MTVFHCKICNRNSFSLASCIDHVYTHRSPRHSCFVPGCWYTSARLTKHLKGTHPDLCEYQCGACKKVFVREVDLRHHSKAVHGGVVSLQHHVHDSSTSRWETSNQFGRNQQLGAQLHRGFASLQHHSNTVINFKRPTTDAILNEFIENQLQPTTDFNKEMNEKVDKICDFLRDHFKPREIVKGGSLGKGTAVKGKSDIDLVLVLNEVRNAADLRERLPQIKKDIIEKLRREPHDFLVRDISETQFAVKFTVEGTHEKSDVDLLPTFHFNDLKSLYSEMKNDSANIKFYSASLVKYQVDFVEHYPANLKNLIRLVKHWRKEKIKIRANGNRIPNSYVMELITIHLWEENTGNDGRFDTLKAFHGVMTALKNYKSLDVVWEENYDKKDTPSKTRKRPLVMDPANPTNNVCSEFQWGEIKTAAINQLGTPMMRGVTSSTWK